MTGRDDCHLEVRQATVEDFPAVQAVAKLSWHHTYQKILSPHAIDQFLRRAYSEYSLRQTLKSEGLWVLERGGEVIGYMRLGSNHGQGYLGAIYLLPETQGRGYGRLLWRRAFEWFEARGLGDVMLTVASENTRARAFYKSLGFVETGETHSQIAGEPLVEISCHLRLPSQAAARPGR